MTTITDIMRSPSESMVSIASDSDMDDIDDIPEDPQFANPYDLKIAAENREIARQKQIDALNKWRKKVYLVSCVLIITSGIMFVSDVWYTNIVGVSAACLGIWGTYKKNSEFLFVYLVLLVLEIIKNAGVFVYYISSDITPWNVFMCVDILIESVAVVPASCYCGYKLYKTIHVHNEQILPT